MMSKKSVAVDILFLILIGILVLVVSIFIYTKVSKTSEEYYCYKMLASGFSEINEKCKNKISTLEKVEIPYDVETSEKMLAIYIAKCWNKANRGYSNQNLTCYTLEFTNSSIFNEYLSKESVLSYLRKHSDVDINRVMFVEKNPNDDIIKDAPIGEYRVLLILYYMGYIIVW